MTESYGRPKTGHFLPAISTMASSYRNPQPAGHDQWRTSSYDKNNGTIPTLQPGIPDLLRTVTMFYPANRSALSTRYTPDDWFKSNQGNYRQSEASRNSAERLRRDAMRLIQDKEQLTRRMQENTSKDIGERLNDIAFWRSELSHEVGNVAGETVALAEVKRRLERALAETERPLQVRVDDR